MSLLMKGPKEAPDFNLVYRFAEAIAGADDPRYVADMLLAFYGPQLDPHGRVDVDLAASTTEAFRAWRPPARGLHRWAPAEVVGQLGTAHVSHSTPSSPSSPSGRSARAGRAGGGTR